MEIKSWVSTDILVEPYTEIDRIEGNISDVETVIAGWSPYITALGWTPGLRTIEWVLVKTELQSFEDRLDLLATVLGLDYSFVTWVGLTPVDYQVLNKYENLTALLELIGTLAPDSFKYTGTFSCGEDGEIY